LVLLKAEKKSNGGKFVALGGAEEYGQETWTWFLPKSGISYVLWAGTCRRGDCKTFKFTGKETREAGFEGVKI